MGNNLKNRELDDESERSDNSSGRCGSRQKQEQWQPHSHLLTSTVSQQQVIYQQLLQQQQQQERLHACRSFENSEKVLEHEKRNSSLFFKPLEPLHRQRQHYPLIWRPLHERSSGTKQEDQKANMDLLSTEKCGNENRPQVQSTQHQDPRQQRQKEYSMILQDWRSFMKTGKCDNNEMYISIGPFTREEERKTDQLLKRLEQQQRNRDLVKRAEESNIRERRPILSLKPLGQQQDNRVKKPGIRGIPGLQGHNAKYPNSRLCINRIGVGDNDFDDDYCRAL